MCIGQHKRLTKTPFEHYSNRFEHQGHNQDIIEVIVYEIWP